MNIKTLSLFKNTLLNLKLKEKKYEDPIGSYCYYGYFYILNDTNLIISDKICNDPYNEIKTHYYTIKIVSKNTSKTLYNCFHKNETNALSKFKKTKIINKISDEEINKILNVIRNSPKALEIFAYYLEKLGVYFEGSNKLLIKDDIINKISYVKKARIFNV